MIFLMMIETPEDRSRFCILYEKYRYLLQKVAMDVLHDCYLAEDAVQDAYLKLAHNVENIKDVDSLRTKRYLIAIAQNAAIDIFRKRNNSANLENSEIAKVYGMKEATVRQRIARGKALIQEEIRKLEENGDGVYTGY